MQIGKNDTNDMKFANLATENYGRNIIIQGLTNRVSRLWLRCGCPVDNQGFSGFFL